VHHLNETFEGVTVQLDGHSFEDCTFNDVTFEYSGGEVQIKNCTIQRFGFVFGGALANGLDALQQLFGTEGMLQLIRGFTQARTGEVEIQLPG